MGGVKTLPASRRMKLNTTLGTEKSCLELVPGGAPYLRWEIGHMVGCVREKDVTKLRDMCEAILARRDYEEAIRE